MRLDSLAPFPSRHLCIRQPSRHTWRVPPGLSASPTSAVPTPLILAVPHADSPPLLPGLPPAPVHSQQARAGGADEAAHGDIHVGDPALGALEAVAIPGLAAAAQLPHSATPHLRGRLRLRLSPANPATWPWALFRRHHHGCPTVSDLVPASQLLPLNHNPLPVPPFKK